MKKKKADWEFIINVLFWCGVCIVLIMTGIITGVLIAGDYYATLAGKVLEGSSINVEVNLNETKLTEELTKNFIPAFNKSFHENLNKSSGKLP